MASNTKGYPAKPISTDKWRKLSAYFNKDVRTLKRMKEDNNPLLIEHPEYLKIIKSK
jgi:hypothetical protein